MNNQCNDCRLYDECNHTEMMKNIRCNFKEKISIPLHETKIDYDENKGYTNA